MLFSSKFKTFKFVTFSKNQQFGELFQKRFATGICDLRGPPGVYSSTPYTGIRILDPFPQLLVTRTKLRQRR